MTRPSSYCKPGGDDPSLASVNMIVYSHPGEGKTVFWGSGGQDVLFMVSDPEGIVSARALGSTPHSVQVTDYDELEECYEWLKNDKPTGFKWIVWDSLTLFQDRVLLDDIMPDAVAQNPRQNEDVPSMREYMINMNRISRYVRMFVDLPYNFGVSCHVMTTTESGGDGTIFMPQVQGKNMPSKIAGYMNVVGYLDKAKVKDDAGKERSVQRMLFQRQGRYYAKDRFNCLVPYMDKPTLPKVDEKVAEWRKTMAAKKEGAAKSPAASAPSTRRRTARS